MSVCAIVAEYNPFHQGHAYHLSASRALSGADQVVVIMSGNFTQRGEPAVVDKFTRARMALRQGADLVLELPVGYAVQPAQFFALGSVGILSQLGVVTHLAFGSECTDLVQLRRLSEGLSAEDGVLSAAIGQGLAAGLSYPQARAQAAALCLSQPGLTQEDILRLLQGSNAILALEYLAALRHWGSGILPLPVQRQGAGHLEQALTPSFASATAIRQALESGELPASAPPPDSWALLQAAQAAGRSPVAAAAFGPMVAYRLRSRPETAAQLPDMAEGLDDRLVAAARQCDAWTDILARTVTRRYTRARVGRALVHTLLGMTQDDMSVIRQALPLYARVLGVRRTALPLLSAISAQTKAPVITRPARYLPGSAAHALLWQWDLLATDLYALAQPGCPQAGQDYTHKLIIQD